MMNSEQPDNLKFVIKRNSEYVKSIEIFSHYCQPAVSTTAVKAQGLRLNEIKARAVATLTGGSIEELYE